MPFTTLAGGNNIRAPGQGQSSSHLQASQMAHAAAKRAAVARVLSGAGTSQKSPGMGLSTPAAPGPDSYKAHVLAVAGVPDAHVGDVHDAIDAAAAGGHFSGAQAAALKAHDGPLMGTPGAQTIATLGAHVRKAKGQPNV